MQEKKPKFKVGDRVIILDDNMAQFGAFKYEIATMVHKPDFSQMETWIACDRPRHPYAEVCIQPDAIMLLDDFLSKLTEVERLLF